jgi:hypothetical protein
MQRHGNGCISRPGLKLQNEASLGRRSLRARCLLTLLALNPTPSKRHEGNAAGEATP